MIVFVFILKYEYKRKNDWNYQLKIKLWLTLDSLKLFIHIKIIFILDTKIESTNLVENWSNIKTKDNHFYSGRQDISKKIANCFEVHQKNFLQNLFTRFFLEQVLERVWVCVPKLDSVVSTLECIPGGGESQPPYRIKRKEDSPSGNRYIFYYIKKKEIMFLLSTLYIHYKDL